MKPVDYFLLGLVALLLLLAIRFWHKGRKENTACGGDCAHCGKTCR